MATIGCTTLLLRGSVEDAISLTQTSTTPNLCIFLDRPRIVLAQAGQAVFDSYIDEVFLYTLGEDSFGGDFIRITPVQGGDDYIVYITTFGGETTDFKLREMMEKDYGYHETDASGVDSIIASDTHIGEYFRDYCTVGNDMLAYYQKRPQGTPESYYKTENGRQELRMLSYADVSDVPRTLQNIHGGVPGEIVTWHGAAYGLAQPDNLVMCDGVTVITNPLAHPKLLGQLPPNVGTGRSLAMAKADIASTSGSYNYGQLEGSHNVTLERQDLPNVTLQTGYKTVTPSGSIYSTATTSVANNYATSGAGYSGYRAWVVHPSNVLSDAGSLQTGSGYEYSGCTTNDTSYYEWVDLNHGHSATTSVSSTFYGAQVQVGYQTASLNLDPQTPVIVQPLMFLTHFYMVIY